MFDWLFSSHAGVLGWLWFFVCLLLVGFILLAILLALEHAERGKMYSQLLDIDDALAAVEMKAEAAVTEIRGVRRRIGEIQDRRPTPNVPVRPPLPVPPSTNPLRAQGSGGRHSTTHRVPPLPY
jgi:hypothetical protein